MLLMLALLGSAYSAPQSRHARATATADPTVERVSVSSTGAQANGRSTTVAITADGRFVLFDSWATNLVRGDTNGSEDVFVREVELGRTIRVSVGPDGRQANGASGGAAISANGRFVLFTSEATNLTRQADRSAGSDVFVRNLPRGKTFRVDVPPGGGQFHDSRWGGLTARGISDSGRWAAFSEWVTHGRGCCADVRTYVRDRSRHTTRRIGGAGTIAEALSPDGRWLTTGSMWVEHRLVDSFTVRDLVTGNRLSVKTNGLSIGEVAVTPAARYLVFDRSPNGVSDDLLRWSPVTGQKLLLISNQAYPAEYSWSYDPVGVSAGGRYAYFTSLNPHLVAGDSNGYGADLFRYDAATKAITRVDLTGTGAEIRKGIGIGRGDDFGSGQAAAVSRTGRWVAFTTKGGQVVPGDTNRVFDVFLRGPLRIPGGS
jgi:hypothetical protein